MHKIIKKLLLLGAVLIGNTAVAGIEYVDNGSVISQEIASFVGPSVKIHYKNVDISTVILDPENNRFAATLIIPPKDAVVSPSLLDGPVKGESVFYIKKYPTAKFIATNAKYTKDERITEIKGNLIIRDISHPVTFKSIDKFACVPNANNKKVCTGKFRTTELDRTKWDLTYGLYLGYSKQAPITFEFSLIEK